MNGPALVFVGGAVVSMHQPDLETGQTVVVEGNRITYAGPGSGAPIPKDARRIDAEGRYLMPGLADMHVHLNFADELGVYLAHGITTVRNMRGAPDHLAWREEVRSGRRPGPTVYTSGPTLGGSPLRNPAFTAVDTPADARRVVAEQAAAGYDFIKVHSRIRADVYAAISEAARARKIAVVGHYLPEVGLEAQVSARQASLEHVGDMAEVLTHALARRMAAMGTFVAPMLCTEYTGDAPASDLPGLLARPGQAWREPSERDRKAVSMLLGAGVSLLAGTDASLPAMRPGESLGLEMRSLAAAGLSPRQVLAAATRNAGQFSPRAEGSWPDFGTIRAGARADLLLLDANPLEDPLRALSPRSVVTNGRLYETSALARLRATH